MIGSCHYSFFYAQPIWRIASIITVTTFGRTMYELGKNKQL